MRKLRVICCRPSSHLHTKNLDPLSRHKNLQTLLQLPSRPLSAPGKPALMPAILAQGPTFTPRVSWPGEGEGLDFPGHPVVAVSRAEVFGQVIVCFRGAIRRFDFGLFACGR